MADGISGELPAPRNRGRRDRPCLSLFSLYFLGFARSKREWSMVLIPGFFFPDCAWFEGVSPSKELGGVFFFTQKEQKLRVSACFFILSKSENDFPPSFYHFF